MLEFQARQTRTAARLGLCYPDDDRWPEIALHGLAYLRDSMWDREFGGWYWMLDGTGVPVADSTKHAHSTAYVITAGVDTYRLTGDTTALALAAEAFEWLEAHLHDHAKGGYFGWATREGVPILDQRDGEPLGHAPGLKDANVHSDLLEAFTVLQEVAPSAAVGNRLAEVYDVLVGRFANRYGSVHYLLYPDLTPVPGVELYGYPFQTAFRLPSAAHVLGTDVTMAKAVARRLVDHATQRSWDAARGGFIEGGPAAPPDVVGGTSLLITRRPWWVQTEALKALLLVGLTSDPTAGYIASFERGLNFVNAELVDGLFSGWLPVARSDLGQGARLGRGVRKGDVWKDASHEADLYMNAIRMLRGIPPLGILQAN
jgi:mannobiose 2-epimerase